MTHRAHSTSCREKWALRHSYSERAHSRPVSGKIQPPPYCFHWIYALNQSALKPKIYEIADDMEGQYIEAECAPTTVSAVILKPASCLPLSSTRLHLF